MTIPHLDEEALSAALDGEGTAEERAHVAGCTHCQAGVARMAAVTRAVAAPVPPRSATDVTAAIERALGSREEAGTPRIAAPRIAAPRIAERVVRRSRPPRRWVTTAAGLAAAVLVVAAVAGIISRSGGGPAGHITSAAGPAAGSSERAATTFAPSTVPGDLGDQSDPVALAHTVMGLLARADATSAQVASPTPALGALPGAPRAAGPPCAAQGPAAAGITTGGAAAVPALAAPLRWRGQPAELLVYRGPAGSVGVVMRTADCARLALLPL